MPSNARKTQCYQVTDEVSEQVINSLLLENNKRCINNGKPSLAQYN